MRSRVLLFLFFVVFTNSTFAFVGPTCTKIKDYLDNKPDEILALFQEKACNSGCKPVIDHIDKWAYKEAALPIIGQMTKALGATPPQRKTIENLAKESITVIKKKCASTLGKHQICETPKTPKAFGDCLKTNLMPVVMNHIGQLMPFVAEPMCQKEKAILEKPYLWETVIPRYIDKYTRVCKKL